MEISGKFIRDFERYVVRSLEKELQAAKTLREKVNVYNKYTTIAESFQNITDSVSERIKSGVRSDCAMHPAMNMNVN
jgi:hypothetical protein